MDIFGPVAHALEKPQDRPHGKQETAGKSVRKSTLEKRKAEQQVRPFHTSTLENTVRQHVMTIPQDVSPASHQFWGHALHPSCPCPGGTTDNSRGQASLRAQPSDGRADGFCALEGRGKNGAKPGPDQIPHLRAFSGA